MSESLEKFYANLLGLEDPWEVSSIVRDSKEREVTVILDKDSDTVIDVLDGRD